MTEFKPNYKWGFAALIFLQIITIFYLLEIYNNFVSDPENYYKNILSSGNVEEKTVDD